VTELTDTVSERGSSPKDGPGSRSSFQQWFRDDASEPVRRNLGLVAVLLLLYAIGAWSRPDIFLHADRLWTNELTVLTLASSVGVIAIGMTFVIISGGIDLSVGALLALASVWSTTVATQQYGAGVMCSPRCSSGRSPG